MDDYNRFEKAFRKRYKNALKPERQPTDREMLQLYSAYKGSNLTSEQWFEQQEMKA